MTGPIHSRALFRCPHCRQRTITTWAKLARRGACPSCGGEFASGSWGLIFGSLVAPVTMFAPFLVFNRIGLPSLWLFGLIGTLLTVVVGGAVYLLTTPLYRKGSTAARWDTITFFAVIGALTFYAVLNTYFFREAGPWPALSYDGSGPKPGDTETVSSSVHYSDGRIQKAFKAELEKAGIPYRIEIRKGEEWVGWNGAQEAAVRAVQKRVQGDDLPPGRAVSFSDRGQQKEFTDWLTKKKLKWELKTNYRGEYVIWEGAATAGELMKQFFAETSRDCGELAATKTKAKSCG